MISLSLLVLLATAFLVHLITDRVLLPEQWLLGLKWCLPPQIDSATSSSSSSDANNNNEDEEQRQISAVKRRKKRGAHHYQQQKQQQQSSSQQPQPQKKKRLSVPSELYIRLETVCNRHSEFIFRLVELLKCSKNSAFVCSENVK